jgi:hypothetical protein
MWFNPHLDWLLDALREKGGTGGEVVGAIMDDAAVIAPPHAITAAQAELERRLHLDGSTQHTSTPEVPVARQQRTHAGALPR